jgi:CheY-like chemotaxis protein
VSDLTKDFRFVDNPFVTGPPFVKFYAGASLITPEGYSLGTVCMLDTVARPNGLSEEERSTLADLAEMTMKVMIDRRYKLNQESETPSQLMAYTAHDMMAPLTSVHLSLSILNNDPSIRAALGEHQLELLNTAASCSELMIRICTDMFEGIIQQDKSKTPLDTSKSNLSAISNTSKGNVPLTNLKELVKSLKMTVDPIPKKVPCIVTMDKNVPNVIVADDLKLFRCAVNLLTNAIDRTTTGRVHLTIRWDGDTLLLFECEDTGPDIPMEEYQYLFQRGKDEAKLRVGLSSIALLMDSMNGEYGFRPKDVDSEGNIITDAQGQRKSGSIFWFSIPLLLPEMLEDSEAVTPSNQRSSDYLEPYPVAPLNSVVEPHEVMQYQSNAQVGGTPYLNTNEHHDIYNQQRQQSTTTVPTSNIIASDTDVDVMDELGKLALDLNASLTDFEPYPVNTDSYKTVTPNTMRQRRALVIDDSSVVRRSLAQTLNQLGFDVTQACDGSEGLRELQKTLFDIVLCDFMMPVMDGVT